MENSEGLAVARSLSCSLTPSLSLSPSLILSAIDCFVVCWRNNSNSDAKRREDEPVRRLSLLFYDPNPQRAAISATGETVSCA